MALRRSVRPLFLEKDGRDAVVRIRTSDLVRVQQHLFRRYPNREWGTFFRFGYRRAPWGVLVCFVDMLLPDPGDLDRSTALTTFREQYSRRAFHLARGADGLGIGVMHSHPAGCHTSPSELDDDMDGYFARELAAYSNGAPYCSLIFQRSQNSGLTFSGRVCDRGSWLPVETMIEVSAQVRRYQSELSPRECAATPATESTTARLQALLGQPSYERLARAVVGIVGCSGTGSPALEVLCRANVGEIVAVDPERLASSNLERLHGSTRDQLDLAESPYKVEIMRDLVHSINPNAKITPIVGNVLQSNVVDHLIRCDALLGCTDTMHGRAALSDLSKHYLLPAIDVGVRMNGADGRITEQLVELCQFAPELPCAFCQGKINSAQLTYELMSDDERAAQELAAEEAARRGADEDQYWRGRPRQFHTVGYLTTAAGALAAGYMEGVLTGTFAPPHPQFQFDIGVERFGVAVSPQSQSRGCTCGSHLGWADQARPYRNIALPDHWPRRAVVLADRPTQKSTCPGA